MSDRPNFEQEEPRDQPPAKRSTGITSQRQLVFPEAVARDNQVRSRIPLVAEAPVFEFEPVVPPPPSTLPKLSRRWRMRLARFIQKYVIWFVVTLLLSVVAVVIVAVFSPTPKPPTPPVRR